MEIKDIINRLRNPDENFATMLHGNGGMRSMDYYKEAFVKAADYLEAGVIPNARYKELNGTLARMCDDSYERNVSKPCIWGKRNDPIVESLDCSISVSGLSSAGSAIKKLAKVLDKNPGLSEDDTIRAMISVFSELNILVQAGDQLKGMAQKREMRTDAEREAEAKYIPPMANKQAFELVQNSLLVITNDLYEGLVDARIRYITSAVEHAIAKSANGAKYRDFQPFENSLLALIATRDRNVRDSKWTWGPESHEKIKTLGTREATDIRDSFVIKNLRKLASVIDRKGNLTGIEIIGKSVDLSGMKGTLSMKFDDGSSFNVTNQVVLSHSVLGKPFYRFPLNFHDIKRADGEMKARPSEEWMNNSF